MQQKDISVTKNPQIDISETPEGHLILQDILQDMVYYVLISFIYCLEIEFVEAIIFLTLSRINRYACPFCSNNGYYGMGTYGVS